MIVILMGVSGSGKTTVGKLLAAKLNGEFADADDFHPPENVAKMRAGVPLTDEDRAPWLATLRELVAHCLTHDKGLVLACSALKESYRRQLQVTSEVKFVHLKGDKQLIAARLENRSGHYMNPALLDSQFETLEEPVGAWVVSIENEPAAIVRIIMSHLQNDSSL